MDGARDAVARRIATLMPLTLRKLLCRILGHKGQLIDMRPDPGLTVINSAGLDVAVPLEWWRCTRCPHRWEHTRSFVYMP